MSGSELELPLGKRTKWYRFWEMVPALISYGMLALMLVLSIFDPLLAAIYLLAMIIVLLIRAAGIAIASVGGRQMMVRASQIDWPARLSDLADVEAARARLGKPKVDDEYIHLHNLDAMSASPDNYPEPKDILQLVIVAAYNEPYGVIEPTIQSLVDCNYNHKQMIVVLAYEERGGRSIANTARRLEREFAEQFRAFRVVEHPASLPDEVMGKGPNITYAAEKTVPWLHEQGIDPRLVIVTTLDCDNKPDRSYFTSVAYEFIVHPNRRQTSFQPLSLYFGNIWDAPAPMRVIALGNTFWTITSSVRPHMLRNFASHSQPLDALIDMNFWSKRSIVEDGHQYWRSFFFFKGDYEVIPIYLPIYQDAVYVGSFKKSIVAQFKQLRRWAYGASDVPYVAVRVFSPRREVALFGVLARFLRLVDSHISLATIAILVTVGGWMPLIINYGAFRNISAYNLPNMVSIIQTIAMVGIFITIILSFKILPPRPKHIKKRKYINMVAQWVLIPITSIFYSAFSSLNAQTHLLLGKYLDHFDVTEKSAAKHE